MTPDISLVVATKDRPEDLRKLLGSLRCQTHPPSEIVIVDSSSVSHESLPGEFPGLRIRYLRHWPPSAAAQRNLGIRQCNPSSSLIGFADDDTTFEPDAFANMLRFWEQAGPEILGAAFNIRNYPARGREVLKRGWLAEQLGLYSPNPGTVSKSGWQTVSGEVTENCFVEWLPSGASVFCRGVFEGNVFDEFFQSYSYLEDLDFSYTVSRNGRLAIVADAGFSHFPSTGGRVSARQFGRFEIRNRLYFVRKHRLSTPRCCLGLMIRFAMSAASGLIHLDSSLLLRAVGNLEELMAHSPGVSHSL
jgi:GT2 family glycosyltransferase